MPSSLGDGGYMARDDHDERKEVDCEEWEPMSIVHPRKVSEYILSYLLSFMLSRLYVLVYVRS